MASAFVSLVTGISSCSTLSRRASSANWLGLKLARVTLLGYGLHRHQFLNDPEMLLFSMTRFFRFLQSCGSLSNLEVHHQRFRSARVDRAMMLSYQRTRDARRAFRPTEHLGLFEGREPGLGRSEYIGPINPLASKAHVISIGDYSKKANDNSPAMAHRVDSL